MVSPETYEQRQTDLAGCNIIYHTSSSSHPRPLSLSVCLCCVCTDNDQKRGHQFDGIMEGTGGSKGKGEGM